MGLVPDALVWGRVGRGEVAFLRSGAPPVSPVGIVMYAVGVGKAVEEELRQIASEPSELHVAYAPDFSTMTHLLENLKGSICPGERIWLGSPPRLALPNLRCLPLLLTPQPFTEAQPGQGLTGQSLVTQSAGHAPAEPHIPTLSSPHESGCAL